MRHAALLLALTLLAPFALADCNRDPLLSTFMLKTTCSYDEPCLEDQANELSVTVETGCYPWWKPCAPFPIEACDIVEWNFGDGTSATVQGSAKVKHVWTQPGYYVVDGVVRNAKGSKGFWGAITVVRTPVVRVHWSADIYTIDEQNGQITLTLEREGDLSRAVTVLITAGTRAATGDAWDRNLQHVQDLPVTIPAGAASHAVTLNVRDDNVYTGEQRYEVFVHEDTGQALLPTSATIAHTEVRILDDESGPTLTVHDMTIEEGDGGWRVINIPHVLSQPLASELILWWRIGGGTATVGTDWDTNQSGEYFLAQILEPGRTRTDLQIRVFGDAQSEDDETIVITMESPQGAPVTFNQPRITITIEDDDLYRLTPARAQTDSGTTVPFTFSTTRPLASASNIALSSSDATIVAVPASVTLPANATQATFLAQTLRAGKATITASAPDGKPLSADVTSVLHTALLFTRPAARLERGKSAYATLTTNPAAQTTVLLESSKPNVVQVPASVQLDANGTATIALQALQPGTADITATLPVEYGLTSEHLRVTVEAELTPRIESITPPFGNTTGGTDVTIRGADLSVDCMVSFGGISATSTWRDDETLLATTAPHLAGSVDVVVTCGAKTATLANGFRYKPARRRSVR